MGTMLRGLHRPEDSRWRTHNHLFFRKRRYAGVVFTRFCDLWFSVFFENVSCFEERV